MSKILSDKVFVKEYELATNEHILDFFRGTIKFCADLLLSLPFSFLAVLAIIISKTEDILIFALILILFSTPLFILSIFTIYESYIELKQYRYRKELFLAEIGMSMKDAKRRYKFIMKEAIYVQSLQKICKLNPQTRSGQVEMIMNWYKFKDSSLVEYLLNNEYKETDFNIYAGHFGVNDVSERKCFANLLFKLAILEDGIHNDEWNTIMTILPKLNFNDNYIDFFIKRYGPLRTESEDSSNNESPSTEEKNVNLLKPYYDLLGLDVGASDEEIKKAYHNLALQHHPDMKKNAGRTKECEEMMAKINEAVEKIRG
jgi:DnaJ-domain-containing protein 1